MILVDTSVWIEFFKAKIPIFPLLSAEIEHQNIFATECIFGELLQGAKDQRERHIIQSYWKNLPKREETGLWIEAGSVSSQEKYLSKGIGLIDAFLIAFTKKHRLKIWTLDKKLRAVLIAPEIFTPR
ncbi:MAG: hypothetical protein A2W61_05870 [Deltaproteobacteria bacterium RIFCSPLOWO2_01_44_7]|nr:MAG: hypothetical protein A2712_04205 [Deltaproteobacteria bacterium RIFCSPHIGHO2_01_FULL_43_49]OGQ16387.1 MAG: hypothetical protein A3D22_02175 [Deltaproteobacteria bacterium RIFCSPHIGHO2_02_FULL_44_53]OGQ27787.1 MAG: hypothetical protein A3D98_08815 [Deltaproteobacteria bacterium RIFCSPHIGHO2_12_FULL_44_21]OGQ32905.1 MAG: hypothetical protein A2979_10105 [Deltaproteobacteria bacterium RIFCSPLOWO2_01_FULL_45_74]OGQ41654.1 MAG: hypothetical protein A2W61_05870 [Deltaproteobacteria bacterium 